MNDDTKARPCETCEGRGGRWIPFDEARARGAGKPAWWARCGDCGGKPAPSADTKARLEEIRARVEKASPGPWLARVFMSQGHDQANAEFIAAAREDVPFLLGEIERLQVALAEARSEADEMLNAADWPNSSEALALAQADGERWMTRAQAAEHERDEALKEVARLAVNLERQG